MNKLYFLILPLILSGCFPDKASIEVQSKTPCFEVLTFQGTTRMPMKIDKCTGDTWLLLNITFPKDKDELTGSYEPIWYVVHNSTDSAIVAGIKKSN